VRNYHLAMRNVTTTLLLLLCSCAVTSCASTGDPATSGEDPDVIQLAEMMAGSFDNEAQAMRAPDEFLRVRLVMVPIWFHREDGRWLYVEQASSSALDRPYRQRVHRLHRDVEGRLRSDVYTLPGDPLEYAACWERGAPLTGLTPDDLELRDGCSITLTRTGPDEFIGATVGRACASSLRGAAYATSEVNLRPGLLISWDRGWDAQGNQAWGATTGGYEFRRTRR
jgi:hypothetical protein